MLATFDDRPAPPDALIYVVSCSAAAALAILADIDHHYRSPNARPRLGAAVQADGSVKLYVYPRIHDIGALLFLLRRPGLAVGRGSTVVHGSMWIGEDRLARMLAELARAFDQEEARHVAA